MSHWTFVSAGKVHQKVITHSSSICKEDELLEGLIPSPLYWQTFCIQDRGLTFMRAYGMLMTCIMFITLCRRQGDKLHSVHLKEFGASKLCVCFSYGQDGVPQSDVLLEV